MFAYFGGLWERFMQWLRPKKKPVPKRWEPHWEARQTLWLEDCKNIKMPRLVRQKRLRLPTRCHRWAPYGSP